MDAIQKMEQKTQRREQKKKEIQPVHNARFAELVRNSIANGQKKAAKNKKGLTIAA